MHSNQHAIVSGPAHLAIVDIEVVPEATSLSQSRDQTLAPICVLAPFTSAVTTEGTHEVGTMAFMDSGTLGARHPCATERSHHH